MQHVSTADVPERHRLAYVHDFIARHWAGMRLAPLDDGDLHVDLSVFDLPDAIGVAKAQYPAFVGSRARDLLGDGRTNYMIAIVSDDHEVCVEGGQPYLVKAGDLALLNEGTSFTVRHERATNVELVSVAPSQIAVRVPRLDFAPFYHVPRTTPGADLFAGYANLLRQAPPEDEMARQAAADHLHDLVAVMLSGFAAQETPRNESSIGAARLELIKKDIQEHLKHPGLSVDWIAFRHSITPRYVQQLFEREGTTFTEFVRESRLELAFHRLNEGNARKGVSAIAFDCGFADLSNFNRAFRKRYGVTPSEVRAQAMRRRVRSADTA